jgi:hypothetical protein
MRQDVEQLAFDFLPQSPVVVQRHSGPITSDAGLIPIAQFDRRWNFTQRLAACIHGGPNPDPRPSRHAPLPRHTQLPMLRQRLFGILAGYEDCNDHDTLRQEPVFKLVADRLPEDEDLASQPTLSRFENSVGPADLQRMIDFNIRTGVERLKAAHGGALPASITLDLDATDDPTHGRQQLTLFHGYYGQFQYFPLIISEPTSKHIFLAWLRHGTAHASLGADDDLKRVVDALRAERPDIAVHVRGDAGFGLPRMYDACEAMPNLTYTLGFTTNVKLKKLTEPLMQKAVEEYERTKQKQRLFMCMSYQCDSWERPRTVVAKAECHMGGTNLRFVVTNLPGIDTPEQGEKVYDDYIQRGESEHRMDELKNGLHMDRLSCHRFMANFFRLLLHTAAMNLLNALRQDPSLPEVLRKGQPCTWRTHLIKVAAVVRQTARRVVVELSGQWPWWPMFEAVGKRALAFQSGP